MTYDVWVIKYILKVYQFWTDLERVRKRNCESIKLSGSSNTIYASYHPYPVLASPPPLQEVSNLRQHHRLKADSSELLHEARKSPLTPSHL